MKTALCIQRMIDFYNGDVREINHFLKVYAFARTIGRTQGLDERMQEILEVAAIVHDIACPLCRAKYGHADGKMQELEGPTLAKDFLKSLGYEDDFISRICFLVGHHHSYDKVDNIDYQILLEADFLVNAFESNYSANAIEKAAANIFKTETGLQLLKSMYIAKSVGI